MEETINKGTIVKLSESLNIPEKVIIKIYRAYWLFIKTTIEALPLKEDLTEEEFNKLKTNFNIPNLGKLTCTYKRYKGVKKKKELVKRFYDKYKKD